MKLFKTKMMSWWEIGIIKFCVMCFGIAIGAYWSDIFAPLALILALIGFIVGMYALYAWVKD
jgi:hypothetical protein